MFTLRLLYRRAPLLGKIFILALLLFAFITTIVRTNKAMHQIRERNSNVHTPRSTQ